MNQDKIWLSSPHMGDKEQAYVNEAFATNWIAPLGPHVNGFEADLQSYNQVAHAAVLTSGTAAIHLAMDLLGVGEGDYVLVQSFTFCASANPITYRGAIPVFIDSEADSWNMSPKALEEAIKHLKAEGKGDKIKAILPVHLYGMPAQMEAIMTIANAHNIPVVEDAAESLGSTYKGTFTGTLGTLGVYSFNGNKIITTSGGGALVSNDKQLVDKARFLSTQARDEAPHYQHSTIGYNYRMSNVLAGIGRGQMAVLDDRIAQRRKNFERYKTYFNAKHAAGYKVQFQEEASGSFSNRWLSCVLIDPTQNKGITREHVRLALADDNIEARPLWKPMHMQPVFSDALFFGEGTSDRLFEIGLCLPSGSNLSEADFDRIFGVLDKVFVG
jgi:dTDP-4-amino-4,6-dideoxygalactose transaminase